jgi:hypothetical protein
MLKQDQRIADADTRDDEDNETQLKAAIAFVEDVHEGRFDFADESGSELPRPGKQMVLGAIRLAVRWRTRRRSPDALIVAGELGGARVPTFDPDIERMLQIGRFAPPVTA